MHNPRIGLVKTTLVDYPGEVAATIFTSGCNLRCPYCHNPELVEGPPPDDFMPTNQLLEFLNRRRTVLTGVCITGGEPLIHSWLPELAEEIHTLGLKVKLDTNGMRPERIASVQADYVAMDIKTAPERYHLFGADPGPEAAGTLIPEAIRTIRNLAPEYEFRTTVLEPFVTEEDVRAIVGLLEPGEQYTLAAFRPGKTLDPALCDARPPSAADLERLAAIARDRGLTVVIRDYRA